MKSPGPKTNSKNSIELGALINEIEQSPVQPWEVVCTWLLAVSIVTGVALYQEFGPLFTVAVILLWVFAGAVAIKLCGTKSERFLRVYENGFCFAQGSALTKIHYSQLDEYCFTKTRVYSAAPLPYVFELELRSHSHENPRTIKWHEGSTRSGWTSQYSLDFDAMHATISEKIAKNMAVKLKVDKKILWGNSTFICDHGIEVRVKSGVFFRERIFIRWSELRDMKFHEGALYLSSELGSWTAKLLCSEPNLFAGYLLVNRLMKRDRENWTVDGQTDKEIIDAMAVPFLDVRDSYVS